MGDRRFWNTAHLTAGKVAATPRKGPALSPGRFSTGPAPCLPQNVLAS